MSRNYRCVKFVNLSLSSLGVFSHECFTFLDMMNDIGINKKQQLYIIKKMINIAIRATFYIFCWRNRNRDSPDLMQFCFFSSSPVFFFFFFFLNNTVSGSICKLPIRSEIYNCTFKNMKKISIIIKIFDYWWSLLSFISVHLRHEDLSYQGNNWCQLQDDALFLFQRSSRYQTMSNSDSKIKKKNVTL